MNAELEAALAMANNANGNSPNALNSDTNANCRSYTTATKVSSAPSKAPTSVALVHPPNMAQDTLSLRTFLFVELSLLLPRIVSLEFLKKEKPSNARCTPTTSCYWKSNPSLTNSSIKESCHLPRSITVNQNIPHLNSCFYFQPIHRHHRSLCQ